MQTYLPDSTGNKINFQVNGEEDSESLQVGLKVGSDSDNFPSNSEQINPTPLMPKTALCGGLRDAPALLSYNQSRTDQDYLSTKRFSFENKVYGYENLIIDQHVHHKQPEFDDDSGCSYEEHYLDDGSQFTTETIENGADSDDRIDRTFR